MATVLPDIRSFKPMTAGEHTERELLLQLQDGLPDSYTVFHHLHLTMARPNSDQHGELDAVVMNRAGDLAALEIKAGELSLDQGNALKRYGHTFKDVGQQSRRQFGQLLERIHQRGWRVRLQHFLTLPHQRVGADDESLSYPRERIIDSEECRNLPGEIQRRLGLGMDDPSQREEIQRFMLNWLGLSLDVTALSQRLGQQVRAISGGLAAWVPRIKAPTGVVRVQATAGSGKTQLALALLEKGDRLGDRGAYICFNRPLADHMRQIAPKSQGVATFHQLCWEHAGKPEHVPDFEAMTARYLASLNNTQDADLDLLVIDELQDLQIPWVNAMAQRLSSDGQLYLLDDPNQCLYPDREPFDVEDAVIVTCQENHRSPRRIVNLVNLLRLTETPVEACGLLLGEVPHIRTHGACNQDLLDQTEAAVVNCISLGYSLDDIVVLTWRGRESSVIQADQLGPWHLRRFSGRYDAQGGPVWSEGSLTIDTLRRFKGQAAPAVVLTEIDLKTFGPLERAMLFVGLTRASMHLELVMSQGAEAILSKAV